MQKIINRVETPQILNPLYVETLTPILWFSGNSWGHPFPWDPIPTLPLAYKRVPVGFPGVFSGWKEILWKDLCVQYIPETEDFNRIKLRCVCLIIFTIWVFFFVIHKIIGYTMKMNNLRKHNWLKWKFFIVWSVWREQFIVKSME